LTNLPPDRQFFRSLVFGFRGTYLMFQSDNLVEARRLYEESIEHSRRVGSVLTTVMNLCDLGDLYLLEGNLHQAEHYYRQAIAEPGEGSNWQSLGGVANISLGMLKLETNDLTTAEEYLQRGIDHTDFWNEIGAVIAHASLARIKQANGDSIGADTSIQLAHKLSARFDSTEFVERFVWLFHIRLWIERGDIAALTRWIEAEGLNVQVDALEPIIGQTLFQYFRGFEYNGLGWWHMACHRPDAAVSVLKQVLADLKNDGWAYLRVQTLAILALAYQAQNKSDLALTTLQEVWPWPNRAALSVTLSN
jgi:tetratricopeptide (TPR) repeat protein